MTMGALMSGLVTAQTPVPTGDRTAEQSACAEIDPGFVATVPESASPIVSFPVIIEGTADATPVDPGFVAPTDCPTEGEPNVEETRTPEHTFRLTSP